MANEDIQIVSVAQVECLCLNRRPGVKGEPIDLDSRAGPHQGRAGSSKKKQRVKTASKDKSITITGVSQLPEVQVRKRRKSCQYSQQHNQTEVEDMPSSSIKIFDDCPPSKMVKVVDESPSMQLKASTVTPEVPAYWTKCDKCYGTNEHYHLITVDPSSQEWFNVCIPMLNVHFTIRQLQRIQNRSLWQRLQSERQLMKRDHPKHFDLNERLLYHTSRAEPRAICEEGLDQRLSRTGNFGQGIYFSDNPAKCNAYWAFPAKHKRQMFVCRVLLGDMKVYPVGKGDPALVREPPKPTSHGKGPKLFDSVLPLKSCSQTYQEGRLALNLNHTVGMFIAPFSSGIHTCSEYSSGNVSGFNEFVVYNMYRVMPEYIVDYEVCPTFTPMTSSSLYAASPSVPLCYVCGQLPALCQCC